MCRLFPCIPIFRGFYIKKTFKKKCVCVVGLKIALLLVKNLCLVRKRIWVNWGAGYPIYRVAAKHTTAVPSFFIKIMKWITAQTSSLKHKRHVSCFGLAIFHKGVTVYSNERFNSLVCTGSIINRRSSQMKPFSPNLGRLFRGPFCGGGGGGRGG